MRRTKPSRIDRARGNVEEGFRTSDHVFEDRYTTTFVHNAQMEPRACVAAWEGDKLTVYTPTGGIANCRTDMARDLGHPAGKSARRLPVHGRQLRQQEPESGRRPDRRDAGQASRRAGEAGALAQRRFHRRARPLADGAVLQGRREQATARCRRFNCAATAAWVRTARIPAAIGGVEHLSVSRTSRASIYPVYTNKTVSGNFRGPNFRRASSASSR